MVEGVAADLAVANHYVIASGSRGIDAHSVQQCYHHIDVSVEGEAYLLLTGNIGKHQIMQVSIHATSSAFPSVRLNAMLLTVVQVHLIFYQLVASEYDAGFHLPHKEAFFLSNIASHILFHSKIKCNATPSSLHCNATFSKRERHTLEGRTESPVTLSFLDFLW